jgi:wobble nucleotide-excising tRNase
MSTAAIAKQRQRYEGQIDQTIRVVQKQIQEASGAYTSLQKRKEVLEKQIAETEDAFKKASELSERLSKNLSSLLAIKDRKGKSAPKETRAP